MKASIWILSFCGCSVLTANQAAAAGSVTVNSAPRSFSVVPPHSWIQQPTTTGSSRVKFSAPAGTPTAECAVIVKEFPSLKNQPQSVLDRQMTEPTSATELAAQMSARFNNVRILRTGLASVSGYPAQLVNARYSVGTPAGEVWSRVFTTTSATTPGLVWTITCGALGKTAEEAEKGYSYWQSEIVRFPTNLKILY